jgi:CheY-like chemotaxis protein
MTRRTVLIVDDSPLNLELATAVMESAGWDVRQAQSAADGIRIAKSEAPSIILMDIGLPGTDGYAAVRLLKSDPLTSPIPTVALTAFAMDGDEQRALDSGFDAYIAKPIQTRTFARAVEAIVENTRSAA